MYIVPYTNYVTKIWDYYTRYDIIEMHSLKQSTEFLKWVTANGLFQTNAREIIDTHTSNILFSNVVHLSTVVNRKAFVFICVLYYTDHIISFKKRFQNKEKFQNNGIVR